MFVRLFSSQLVWLLIISYLFLWTELYEESRTDWLFYRCSSLKIISFTYHSHEFGIPTSKSFVQLSEISHRQTQLRRPDGAPLGRKLLQVPSLSHLMTAVAAVRARPVRHFPRLAPPAHQAYVPTASLLMWPMTMLLLTPLVPAQTPLNLLVMYLAKGAKWRSIVININSLVGKVACIQNLPD